MLVLQNNVDIVEGAKLFCIYNLNNGKLYSLDSECVDYVNLLLERGAMCDKVPPEIRDYLIKEGILVEESDLVEKSIPDAFDKRLNFAWIEITQNCNLICRHCYENSSREERRHELSFSDFKYAIDLLQVDGVKKIQLVGGEPLVHSRIRDFMEYAAGKFEFIEIYTNGTLLNDALIDYISRKKISLAFSVYSDKADVHDYVTRTKGSYEITSRNIKKVIEKGIPIRVAAVEMIGIPRYEFFDKNISYRSDLPRLTGRADLSLYDRDMLKRKLITKNTFRNPIKTAVYYHNKEVHNCFGDRFYIDSNLDVYPCAMERRVKYGNLKKKSIESLMSGELPKMTKDKIKECRCCEYRYACYDCRADSNNSPIDAKPWYCTYNPIEGIWADPDQFVDLLLGR